MTDYRSERNSGVVVTERSPLVSVVMGVLNSEDDLAQTMDSVLSQRGIDFEFIIIDDGSIDRTGAILDEYVSRDRRVRVVHQENRGLTQSLILGCALAKGEYIARQDAGGDTSLPDRLAEQVAFLERNQQVVMTSCGTAVVGPRGEDLYTISQEGRELQLGLQGRTTSTLRGPSSHGSAMFRAAAYQKVGGYRAEFPVAQDLDLWVRMAEIGECWAMPAVLYKLILAKGAISHMRRDEQVERTKAILASAKRRRVGESDSDVVTILSSRSGKRRPEGPAADARFFYFIASLLRKRNPIAAADYYRQALENDLWHLKAWAGLFAVTLANAMSSVGGLRVSRRQSASKEE